MNDPLPPSDWIAAETYAAEAGIALEIVVRWIRSSQLEGGCFGQVWYVAPPLIAVEFPSDPKIQTVRITISACRLGPLLSAGRAKHVFAVDLNDERTSVALAALNEAMCKPPLLPLAIELGGEHLLIDSSLWCDLGAALVEIEVLRKGRVNSLEPDGFGEESDA